MSFVYLATHDASVVDADRLREALWPGRPPGSTLHTTASVARNHLGRAADGTSHFPLPSEHRYRLADSVGTDYDRFLAGVRRAQSASPEDAVRTLRAALDLVRGRPFDTAGRGYHWAHVEGHHAVLEAEVATAAHQLAERYLAVGDAEGARWAARQGLRASPGNEVLFRDQMLAADRTGNTAGVEAVMSELCHVMEEDGVPFDSGALHPETLVLYERLTRRAAVRSPA